MTGAVPVTAALATVTGVIWLLIVICRIVIAFVAAHRTAIVSVLIVVFILFVIDAAVRAMHAHEAKMRRQRLQDRARLEAIDAMSGQDFEHFIADLLRDEGYRHVEVVGRSGDQGADITARTRDGRKIAVQCKRQAAPVGADRIRNLIGAVHCAYTGHQAVLVTSARFTRPALDEGDGHVVLVDRNRLVEWMRGKPLGL
ncbi:restriction endonuclease [Nonomuraea sp. NPDC049695]|uniref:restriction endonuclease n=1 Tax=Nonomuraea sp. NPDC049695 TaxID=3154734 RepID=UPI003413D36E